MRSLNPEVAVVDRTGAVVASRPGRFLLEVSAGGWRVDTFALDARENPDSVVLRETWNGLEGQWRAFGEPRPEERAARSGERALYLGGDGVYHSGVYVNRPFDGSAGIAIRTTVSTPIAREQWQQLSLLLTGRVDWGALAKWDHRNGYVTSAVGSRAFQDCLLHYPPPYERPFARDSLEVASWHDNVMVAAPERMGDGTWHDLVLQFFPDGRCAVAIDGRPVAITKRATYKADSVMIAILGNSVGTNILVGPLEVRQGVYRGIDWFGRTRQPPN